MTRRNAQQPWWQQFAKKGAFKKKHPQKAVRAEQSESAPPSQPLEATDAAQKDDSSQSEAPAAGYVVPSAVKRVHMPALVITGKKSPQGTQIPVWVYDTSIVHVEGVPHDGEAVAIFSKSGKFFGSAIYNSASKIRARLFSYDLRNFDDDYVEQAIVAAWNRRRVYFSIEDSLRVVFSEADGLPGLIVDKLSDVIVVQILTLAIEQRREVVLRTLKALFAPRAIVIRRDISLRAREGLEVGDPQISGELSLPFPVELDGIVYLCDPVHGQKTGLYLDQRFNRRLLIPWARRKKVLDLFCHVGGWALMAAKAGAEHVIGVDSAGPAIELARQSAQMGGFEQVQFVEADVFDYLEEQRHRPGAQFDVIIVDPPAFAKSQKHLTEAERAYLSLNYRAMRLLPPGGLLVTCSCSQHISEEHFQLILETAARNARMRFQIVARGGQPPDHPELLGFAESRYLKCFFLLRVE